MDCPDEQTILSFVNSSLSVEKCQEFERHLDHCESCQQLLAMLYKTKPGRGTAKGSADPEFMVRPDPDATQVIAESFPPGKRVERYRIMERLGAGGMGSVYAALDLELDRQVALKFIRADLFPPDQQPAVLLRLKQEAQALARLSHPNVVVVHDVGIWEGKCFIVMELVDGYTLTSWLAQGTRNVPEILDVLCQAGKGLATTHQAGLVHQDIKPSNVLISKDGWVKVTDFGLVRSIATIKSEPTAMVSQTTPTQNVPPQELKDVFTSKALPNQHKTVEGTPGYMAPEQMLGQAASFQSDQFSFCVTAFEALFGERPFAGSDRSSLQQEILSGKVRRPPAGIKVPGWLHRAIVKGLSVDPHKRHPSMTALLSAMDRNLKSSKWRKWTVAALGALLAAAVLVWSFGRGSPCPSAGDKFTGMWDEARKQSIHRAFDSVDKPFAGDAWRVAEKTLDGYHRQWLAIHQDACEATLVRREQSDELMDMRMECLNQRLEEFRTLTDLLVKADASLVEKSVQAASTLSDLRDCQYRKVLSNRVRPPEDPVARAEVKRIREELAKAKALLDAGKFQEGQLLVNSLVQAAEKTAYPPIQAEALYWHGAFEINGGEEQQAVATLTKAMNTALAARHSEFVARAAIDLVYAVGGIQAQHEEGLKLGETARAALAAMGQDDGLEGLLCAKLGHIYYRKGLYPEALSNFQRAQILIEKAYGPESPKLIPILNGLGNSMQQMGNTQAALHAFQQALGLVKKTVGLEHPAAATALHNLGVFQGKVGDYGQALSNLGAALAIVKATQPTNSRKGRYYYSFGLLLLALGQHQEALSNLDSALTFMEKTLGPQHPDVAMVLTGTATAHRLLGFCDRAWSDIQKSMAIFKQHSNPLDPYLSYALTEAGSVLCCLGRCREAINLIREAQDLSKKITPNDIDVHIICLWAMADTQFKLGNHTQAMQHYQNALTIVEKERPTDALAASRPLAGMARIFYQRGDYGTALGFFQRSLDLVEKTFEKDYPDIADDLTGIGKSYLGMGKVEEAIPYLARAMKLREAYQANRADLGETRFALARALWQDPQQQNRLQARELAEAALKDFREAQGPHQRELAEVKSWLAAHRPKGKKSGAKTATLP